MNEQYKENPSKFCEDYLGIELHPFQKQLLDKVVKEDNPIIYYPYRSGRAMFGIMYKILYSMNLNESELFWIKKFTSKEVYNKVLDNNQSK